jgi:tRNA-specific 2-thiouridylase
MATIIEKHEKTVVVAMSGGVDSSVAAVLLHERGYDVIGVTMNLWDYDRVGGNINKDSGCCSIDTMDDARAVCNKLGIPHYVVSFREQFQSAVTDNFIAEYLQGRTPNPCVRCNTFIKWGALLQKAEELGAARIATGHYARCLYDEVSGRYILKTGVDIDKDQSYALWGIKQRGLADTLFPVGEFRKEEIRQLARQYGLPTADKKESQEICFIPDNDYARYLKKQRPELSDIAGEIVTQTGDVVGKHKGYPFYTIGQRKGLGLSRPEPVYVTEIDSAENRVTIGADTDLEHKGLIADSVNWVSIAQLDKKLRIAAKIRYNSPATGAKMSVITNDRIYVEFDESQRAVTPGQSVVLYQNDTVACGAIIQSFIKSDSNKKGDAECKEF